jgi:hypothetical protein
LGDFLDHDVPGDPPEEVRQGIDELVALGPSFLSLVLALPLPLAPVLVLALALALVVPLPLALALALALPLTLSPVGGLVKLVEDAEGVLLRSQARGEAEVFNEDHPLRELHPGGFGIVVDLQV